MKTLILKHCKSKQRDRIYALQSFFIYKLISCLSRTQMQGIEALIIENCILSRLKTVAQINCQIKRYLDNQKIN